MGKKKKGGRVVCRNRRARHDYYIDETFEAGMELAGSEVKSLREGKASIAEAYARFHGGELWLEGAHISQYSHSGHTDHDPTRPRKLLLKNRELGRLHGMVERKGYTLIPLKIYFNARGWAKCLLGLGKGKKDYDKRRDLKKKDAQRRIERALRDR